MLQPRGPGFVPEAADALRETRVFLSALLVVDAGHSRDPWMFSGTMLGAVRRILAELEVEERRRPRRAAVRG